MFSVSVNNVWDKPNPRRRGLSWLRLWAIWVCDFFVPQIWASAGIVNHSFRVRNKGSPFFSMWPGSKERRRGRVWTSDTFQDQALIDLASPSIYLSSNLCITTAQNGGFRRNIFTYAYHVIDSYSLPYWLSTTSPASPSMPYAHTESCIPMYVCNLDASQERKRDICLSVSDTFCLICCSLSLVSLVSLKGL